MANPQRVATRALSDGASRVVAAGHHAYVTHSSPPIIEITDFGNPGEPVAIGAMEGAALAVSDERSLLLVSAGSGELRLVDISRPSAPRQLGALPIAGQIHDAVLLGDLALLAGEAGFSIVDVSNPANPSRIAGYNTAGSAYRVAASGGLVCLLESSMQSSDRVLLSDAPIQLVHPEPASQPRQFYRAVAP